MSSFQKRPAMNRAAQTNACLGLVKSLLIKLAASTASLMTKMQKRALPLAARCPHCRPELSPAFWASMRWLFLLSSPVGKAFIYFSADRAAKDCAKSTVQVDVSLLQAALAADLCAPMSVGSSNKVSENRKRTTLLCLGVCSRTIGCSTIGPTTNWTFANCMKE